MPYSTHLLRHLRFTIGQNIHSHRVKQKLPLHKLSCLSGIPLQKIDHYELGKSDIRLEELLRIACAMGTEVRVLMGDG